MKIRKNVCLVGLVAVSITACTPQKTIKKTETVKRVQKNNSDTSDNKKTNSADVSYKKEYMLHIGGFDFYKKNIADITKNDNTESYGSIVSAKPSGYMVTKNYFPSVAQNFRQRFLILHYTALNNDKSISTLTEKGVSSHYIVGDPNDREIYQIVDENKRAYHAGISYWRGFENLNDSSIGIEIVNPGYVLYEGRKQFFNYPEWQYRKIAALAKDIINRYNLSPVNVLGHSDIAPTRKHDPGPKFPWKRLYNEYKIGMWYDEATKRNLLNQIDAESFYAQSTTAPFILKIQSMLGEFGYKIENSGELDENTTKTITAFQYHFRPENCSGIMDRETYAILQALLLKYPR
ncbi:MAG: N-acetylmuramoyl-L-alanine amidase [Bergeyella sp.]|nr:N-acetylmuramoyl-L-alanine amidase [Bergeyella sp.]